MDRYENVVQQSRVEAAFISIDPFTGAIAAMVGGSDTKDGNQFNRAIQSLRQPGSSFKIFVYGAGIESNRITAATQFHDLPMVFHEGKREWIPSNYGKDFSGMVLTRRAVAASINTSSVSALEKIGTQKVIEFASNVMDIPQKRFHEGPSLALGTSEVSPIEMACGIASFANGGYKVIPYAIKEITDNQSVRIYEHVQPPQISVMQPSTAYIMTAILRGVVDNGTANGGVRREGNFKLPAAGKTGTNTKLRDAWFAGYTPDLASVIWIGCNSQNFSLGYGGAASELAAPIWGKIMRDVYTFRKNGSFAKPPDNVEYFTICLKSGKLCSIGCNGIDECFVKGTAPFEQCDGEHVEVLNPVSVTKNNIEDLKEKMKTKAEAIKTIDNDDDDDKEEYEMEVIEFD
jgi:penicillin-binding protein 1A